MSICVFGKIVFCKIVCVLYYNGEVVYDIRIKCEEIEEWNIKWVVDDVYCNFKWLVKLFFCFYLV